MTFFLGVLAGILLTLGTSFIASFNDDDDDDTFYRNSGHNK